MRSAFALVVAVTSLGLAHALPFSGLSDAEWRALAANKPVIHIVKHARDLSILPVDAAAKSLRDEFLSLKPNYLAELMLSVPAGIGLEALETALLDFTAYPDIRYYSERNKTDYALFDKLRIDADENKRGLRSIKAMITMLPFDDYPAFITMQRLGRSLEFRFENLGPIVYSYQNLKAADSGEMIWRLYANESEGRLFVYAAGGIKAFDLFGVFRERLEASFIGRIKSFFGYAFARALAAQ